MEPGNDKNNAGRTGDPFKDFGLDLKKITDEAALAKIKQGRDATYQLIDMLYRTDWKFETKTQGVKIYNLVVDGKKP